MKELAETHYGQADRIRLIQDNLNTPCAGSFYGTFKPEEAFALARRFEMYYTPLISSWLNMVEIELSVLSKQGLDHRIGDKVGAQHAVPVLQEVLAWVKQRDAQWATVEWRFSKNKAREKEKFQRFYVINQN